MKEKIIAFCLLILVIGFVIGNTIALGKQIDGLCNEAEALKIIAENIRQSEVDAEKLYENFKRKEMFISLTVNHEDLTNIENTFSEMIGYLSVGDESGAKVMKNRLVDSLEHLRRLSGFNIDAII